MLGHTTADKTTVIGSCIWARSGQNLCGPVGGTIANRFWSNELVSTVLFLLLVLRGRARKKKKRKHSCLCLIKTEKGEKKGFFREVVCEKRKMGLRFNYFSSLAFAVALCLFVVFLFVFFLVEDPSLVVVLLAFTLLSDYQGSDREQTRGALRVICSRASLRAREQISSGAPSVCSRSFYPCDNPQ